MFRYRRLKWMNFTRFLVAVSATILFYQAIVSQSNIFIVDVYKSRYCQPNSQRDRCGRPNCIKNDDNVVDKDVTTSMNIQNNGNNVFFVETSGKSWLNTRQACAVESAALNNPELPIQLFMTSSQTDDVLTMRILRKYQNVHIHSINLADLFLDTPLEWWYFCTSWNNGPFAISHLSDAIRFLILYKYGGYYIDLDMVILKSLSQYRNFAVPESQEFLAAGAIHLEYGHDLAQLAIDEFRLTYKKQDWGYNGPEVLTRSMKKLCQVNDIPLMKEDNCRQIRVFDPKSFYPIHWKQWENYFIEDDMLFQTIQNQSLAIHVWNKFSEDRTVTKFSNQIYEKFARIHCPRVYEAAETIF